MVQTVPAGYDLIHDRSCDGPRRADSPKVFFYAARAAVFGFVFVVRTIALGLVQASAIVQTVSMQTNTFNLLDGDTIAPRDNLMRLLDGAEHAQPIRQRFDATPPMHSGGECDAAFGEA